MCNYHTHFQGGNCHPCGDNASVQKIHLLECWDDGGTDLSGDWVNQNGTCAWPDGHPNPDAFQDRDYTTWHADHDYRLQRTCIRCYSESEWRIFMVDQLELAPEEFKIFQRTTPRYIYRGHFAERPYANQDLLNTYLPADPIGPDGVIWRQHAPLKYHAHRNYVLDAEFFRDDRARAHDRWDLSMHLRIGDAYRYEDMHWYLSRGINPPSLPGIAVQPYEHHGFPMEPPTIQPMVTEEPDEQLPVEQEPWFLDFIAATDQLGIPAESVETESPD